MADSDWRRMYEEAAKRSAYFAARLAEAERECREWLAACAKDEDEQVAGIVRGILAVITADSAVVLPGGGVAVDIPSDFGIASSAAVIAAGTEWKSGAKVVTCAKCGEGLTLRATGPVLVLPHECTVDSAPEANVCALHGPVEGSYCQKCYEAELR